MTCFLDNLGTADQKVRKFPFLSIDEVTGRATFCPKLYTASYNVDLGTPNSLAALLIDIPYRFRLNRRGVNPQSAGADATMKG